MECQKCKKKKFYKCVSCSGNKWRCEGCGFLAPKEYFEGKPLPHRKEHLECPNCGRGADVIEFCLTCKKEFKWICENCGHEGNLEDFRKVVTA